MVKIYSDKTQRFYNTVEEAQKAEQALIAEEEQKRILKEKELALAKQKKEQEVAERKACATEVDEARKAYLAAQKTYREKLEGFCKKYGTYHYTVENGDEIPSLFDIFGNLFKF